MVRQIPLIKEWRDIKHENTMYSDSQLLALWDDSVYLACPLFLDYPDSEFPTYEKLKFKKAIELRADRVAKEVRTL